MSHTSACAVHNMPASPNGPCNCGEWARENAQRLYGYLVSDNKGFSLPARRDIELAEYAIATALIAAEKRGRIQGLKMAKAIAASFPASYSDGAPLHAENMTAARISLEISARITELEKDAE